MAAGQGRLELSVRRQLFATETSARSAARWGPDGCGVWCLWPLAVAACGAFFWAVASVQRARSYGTHAVFTCGYVRAAAGLSVVWFVGFEPL